MRLAPPAGLSPQPSNSFAAKSLLPPSPLRSRVIQRIGENAFGYRVEKPAIDKQPEETERLRTLAIILGNTIETLRLRESIWRSAKERTLAAGLTTYSDREKVVKIKDALFLADKPVPATTDLRTLELNADVIALKVSNPRLRLELQDMASSAKSAAIKNHALTVDADVTGTRGLASRRFDFDTLLQDPILAMQIKQNGLIRVGDQIQTDSGTVLITLFHGDDAFTQKAAANSTPGQVRAVYSKRGKDPGPRNEYIKDDKGVFTRRYAYVEKNKYQFRDLVNQSRLAGRYPQDVTSPSGTRPYNEVPGYLRKSVPGLSKRDRFANAYQLAYVHQELGSGPQQRGVSATSSPKYHIFSNQGESFRTRDGVRLEVDLSRVAIGTDTAPQLINHYAYAARQNSRASIGTFYIKKKDHQRNFAHYEWSVKKNRELFIKEVTPGAVHSITLHQTSSGAVHREVRPGGFLPAHLVALGQHVQLPRYKEGFLDGRDNRRHKIFTTSPETTAYQEGRADGVQYSTAYGIGWRKEKANPAMLNDPKNVRYIQGYWDGYYRRAKRTF